MVVTLLYLVFASRALPQSLCSAVLYAEFSGRIAGTIAAPEVSILPSPRTAVSPRLHPTTPFSVLLPFLFPCLPQFTHLQLFRCVNLSDVFVCSVGNPVLNYSCLRCCNFKKRYQKHYTHATMFLEMFIF